MHWRAGDKNDAPRSDTKQMQVCRAQYDSTKYPEPTRTNLPIPTIWGQSARQTEDRTDYILLRRKLRIYIPVLTLVRLVLYLSPTAVQRFQADTFPPILYVTLLLKAHVRGRADGYGDGRVRGDARVQLSGACVRNPLLRLALERNLHIQRLARTA